MFVSPLADDLKDILRTFFDNENRVATYQLRVDQSCRNVSHLDLCVALDLVEVSNKLCGSPLLPITAEELTAMYDAARAGSVTTIKMLFDLMDARQAHDNELIHIAASAGHIEAIHIFIDHGLDVDSSLALPGAVNSDQVEVVHWLLSHGANPHPGRAARQCFASCYMSR